ncbi:hypothetical protein IV203_037356 [Nitzschia inconspicua]|uniref:Uncharacterized protein n=1 Tax=Nitzschia inconspicua TaxID=303405 RepID=A0A9K3Q0X6_9STRA|nr:hypothetical protein IV203_037356 [Nitzschia inconspicua]
MEVFSGEATTNFGAPHVTINWIPQAKEEYSAVAIFIFKTIRYGRQVVKSLAFSPGPYRENTHGFENSLANLEVLVRTMNSSETVISSLVFDNCETTIFADNSELSPLSLNATLKGSKTTCSPKSAYFPVKLPLKLAESQSLKSMKLGTSYKSRMEQPLGGLSHRSTIWQSEHRNDHDTLRESEMGPQESSHHSSIFNSHHIRESFDLTETKTGNRQASPPTKNHPLRRSMKRLMIKTRLFKSWSRDGSDESGSPLLNSNALRNERSLDMALLGQENIAAAPEKAGRKSNGSDTWRELLSCSSTQQVLSPSVSTHERGSEASKHRSMSPCQHDSPPRHPSESPKEPRIVRFTLN